MPTHTNTTHASTVRYTMTFSRLGSRFSYSWNILNIHINKLHHYSVCDHLNKQGILLLFPEHQSTLFDFSVIIVSSALAHSDAFTRLFLPSRNTVLIERKSSDSHRCWVQQNTDTSAPVEHEGPASLYLREFRMTSDSLSG